MTDWLRRENQRIRGGLERWIVGVYPIITAAVRTDVLESRMNNEEKKYSKYKECKKYSKGNHILRR